MYEIIKTVIKTGSFELSDILKKIDTQWIHGKIADDQREELIQAAREKAKPETGLNLIEKVAELEKRILALEKRQISEDSTTEDTTTPGEETTEPEEPETPGEAVESYPEYVVGKWYYNGDKVTFDGLNYECIAPDGVVCVWNPAEYPAYWQEVNKSIEESIEESTGETETVE